LIAITYQSHAIQVLDRLAHPLYSGSVRFKRKLIERLIDEVQKMNEVTFICCGLSAVAIAVLSYKFSCEVKAASQQQSVIMSQSQKQVSEEISSKS
jgi:hypothetical protein